MFFLLGILCILYSFMQYLWLTRILPMQATLEEMIKVFREAAAAREAAIAQAHHATDGDPASPSLSAASSSPSVVMHASPGGPVQMTTQNTAFNAEIEGYIRATLASGGQQVAIIKQGYLNKRSQGKGRSDWKRRFFVLDSNGMMYYYSHKVMGLIAVLAAYREQHCNHRCGNSTKACRSTENVPAVAKLMLLQAWQCVPRAVACM